jgi:hypothetical protein
MNMFTRIEGGSASRHGKYRIPSTSDNEIPGGIQIKTKSPIPEKRNNPIRTPYRQNPWTWRRDQITAESAAPEQSYLDRSARNCKTPNDFRTAAQLSGEFPILMTIHHRVQAEPTDAPEYLANTAAQHHPPGVFPIDERLSISLPTFNPSRRPEPGAVPTTIDPGFPAI